MTSPRRLFLSTLLPAALAGVLAPAGFGQDKPPATAPSLTANGDWPAFHGGGPLRGAANPLAAAPVTQLSLRWTYKAGDEETAGIEGSAAIVGQTVYVGDGKGKLHAIDLATGKNKWTYKGPDGFAASPVVAGGKVMIGDLGGMFHAVSAADGTKAWTFDSGSTIHAPANVAGDGPAARIVFGNDGAGVYCLNVADGAKVWEQKTGDRVNGAPAIGGGVALVSGCDAQLRALSLKDGAEQFTTDLGALCPGSPAVLPDRIIVGTDGGRVVAFSTDGKTKLWTYEGIEDNAMVYASPAEADGVVVVGARDRKVHGIDAATGKGLWKFATRGDVDSAPVVSGGRVFVGSKDKKLYVLDLKTGEKVTEFTAARQIIAGPAVGGGVVVVGDTVGNVYCLEPKGK